MARSLLRKIVVGVGASGYEAPLVGATVDLYTYGTTTPYPYTLYPTRTSMVPISTTQTTNSVGEVEWWVEDLTPPATISVTHVSFTGARTETLMPLPDPEGLVDTDALAAVQADLDTAEGEIDTLQIEMDAAQAAIIVNADDIDTNATAITTTNTLITARRRWLSVKESPYNAAGDGTTDDTAAIQAAINAAGAAGLDVYFPKGAYAISVGLYDHLGVNLIGQWSDVSDTGSGSNVEITRILWRPGGTGIGGVMLTVFAGSNGTGTPGQVVTGGGIDGLLFDGYKDNLTEANTAVWLRGTQHYRIGRMKIRNVAVHGIWFDDYVAHTVVVGPGNDVFDAAVSTSNYIEDLDWVHGSWNGTRMVGANAVGVYYHGSSMRTQFGGSTRQFFTRIRGQFYNGAVVLYQFADNNHGAFVHGIGVGATVDYPAGTGYAVQFTRCSSAADANWEGGDPYGFPAGNVIENVNGSVYQDDHCHGNEIKLHSSEGGVITRNNNSHMVFEAFDFVTLARHQTHRYAMIDQLAIPAGAMQPGTDVVFSEVGSLWGGWALHATNTSRVSWWGRPYNWGTGTVVRVRLYYTMGSNNTGTKKIVLRIRMAAGGITPTVDVAINPTVDNTAGTHAFTDFTVSLDYTLRNDILVLIQREPGDANDDASGVVHVYGILLVYESDGPVNTGSGSYTPGGTPFTTLAAVTA